MVTLFIEKIGKYILTNNKTSAILTSERERRKMFKLILNIFLLIVALFILICLVGEFILYNKSDNETDKKHHYIHIRFIFICSLILLTISSLFK